MLSFKSKTSTEINIKLKLVLSVDEIPDVLNSDNIPCNSLERQPKSAHNNKFKIRSRMEPKSNKKLDEKAAGITNVKEIK